jgi:hypothetical protein
VLAKGPDVNEFAQSLPARHPASSVASPLKLSSCVYRENIDPPTLEDVKKRCHYLNA